LDSVSTLTGSAFDSRSRGNVYTAGLVVVMGCVEYWCAPWLVPLRGDEYDMGERWRCPIVGTNLYGLY
jgi:hypothetical protein